MDKFGVDSESEVEKTAKQHEEEKQAAGAPTPTKFADGFHKEAKPRISDPSSKK